MYDVYLSYYDDLGPMMIEEVKRYVERSHGSREIYEKVSDYIPYGVNSNQRYYPPYPLYFRDAKGTRIWDVDNNEYIDFNMGYGALIVGHSHPLLVKELKKQLEKGMLYTFPHELLDELSEMVTDLFDIDMFRISNSGSEAVMYALRLARAYTGRDVVIKVEGTYHGTYDHVLISTWPYRGLAGPRKMPVSVLESMGVPDVVEDLVRIVPYNDTETLEDILDEEGDDVAALIVEPVMMNAGIIKPVNNYLKKLRKLTRDYDIVLIFDEVKTGMRNGPRTAAQEYKVEPDIITMAKAIGGGATISLIGGKEEIISLIGPSESMRERGVVHAGTYNANPIALRSMYITLKEILVPEVYKEMFKLNSRLKEAYEKYFEEYDIDAYVETYGVSGAIIFSDKKVKSFREVLDTDMDLWYPYYFAMINNGIIPMATGPEEMWTLSVQHTEEDIEAHIEKLDYAMKLVKETMEYMEEED